MAIHLSVKETEKDGVNDGIYPATLSGVSMTENTYGERLGFQFTLPDGKVLLRTVSPTFTPKSKVAEILSGLTGHRVSPAEAASLDVEGLIGTQCQVIVTQSQNKAGVKYSNIERVLPAN